MSANKPKFKVGDVIKEICPEGSSYRTEGYHLSVISCGPGFVAVDERDLPVGAYRGPYNPASFEIVRTSPIRTLTRREIVPGDYGIVQVVSDRGDVRVGGKPWGYTADDLREAAHLFNQIAEVLEENQKAAA